MDLCQICFVAPSIVPPSPPPIQCLPVLHPTLLCVSIFDFRESLPRLSTYARQKSKFFLDSVCVSHVTKLIEGKTYHVTERKERERAQHGNHGRHWPWQLELPMPCPHMFQLNKFVLHILGVLCALGSVGNEWEPALNEHFTTRQGRNGGVLCCCCPLSRAVIVPTAVAATAKPPMQPSRAVAIAADTAIAAAVAIAFTAAFAATLTSPPLSPPSLTPRSPPPPPHRRRNFPKRSHRGPLPLPR